MATHTSSGRRHLFAIAGLLILTTAIFGQSLSHEFIALDDGPYVARNPHISDHLTWQGLRWALTDIVVNNWHPVTMLSHALVAAAFGLEPGPHHAVNVVLHALNACLLYLVLFRMTGGFWPSLVVAVVFAVHPLRVESVAWVSERKGLLCGFFGLLSLLAYERYVRRPRAAGFIPVTLAFVLGLLSKPALVALPFGLLLLDVWPLHRFRDAVVSPARRSVALVIEKLPLFIVAAGSSIITYLVQDSTGAVGGLDVYPVSVRAANALESYMRYLAATFVPVRLAPQYPHPGEAVFAPRLVLAALVFAALTVAAAAMWKRRPWFAVGWLWFVGMLVPAIGLVQVGTQARADRYTYLPQIGILVIVAWGLDELRGRFPRLSRPLTVAVAVWVIALAAAAFLQTARWKDDFTLFSYTVARAPSSSQAHYGLGVAYVKRGDLDAAEACFLEAIRHPPLLAEAYSNLGAIELRRGDLSQSAEHFARAVELDPRNPDLHVNYGIALLRLGRVSEASDQADAALGIRSDFPRGLELHAECVKAGGPSER
jgi:tetratricopeptide (TPR) repeat protein